MWLRCWAVLAEIRRTGKRLFRSGGTGNAVLCVRVVRVCRVCRLCAPHPWEAAEVQVGWDQRALALRTALLFCLYALLRTKCMALVRALKEETRATLDLLLLYSSTVGHSYYTLNATDVT